VSRLCNREKSNKSRHTLIQLALFTRVKTEVLAAMPGVWRAIQLQAPTPLRDQVTEKILLPLVQLCVYHTNKHHFLKAQHSPHDDICQNSVIHRGRGWMGKKALGVLSEAQEKSMEVHNMLEQRLWKPSY